MLIDDFNQSIEYWINALDRYSIEVLRSQPCQKDWSLGQLYMHLIYDTNFFIEQIHACVDNNDHADQQAHDFAKQLFKNNAFPEIKIEGNPNNAFIPQPENKAYLKEKLLAIKDEMNALAEKIYPSTKGKSQHPGLGYFTPAEWMQFADIHFRHHVKQQQRIEQFLGIKE